MHGRALGHVQPRTAFKALIFIDRVVKLDGTAGHDCRDCMFINQLDLSVTTQQNAEIIKPRDHALKFHAVDKKNRKRRFGFPDGI